MSVPGTNRTSRDVHYLHAFPSQRIAVKTGDELEALADQFNAMAGQLQESYAGLEKKVEERTHELETQS